QLSLSYTALPPYLYLHDALPISALDRLQRFVSRDRQQRGHHGASRDLLAEILGDALENDVAQATGIDVGGNGSDCDLRDHSDAEDRKSTRLNSSHQIISYDVLCF